MTRAGTLSLTLLCALASACAPAAAPANDAAPDARPADATAEPLRFALDEGAGLVLIEDGDAVPLVWGLQGGVMITPSLVLPGRVTGDVEVTLENVDPSTGLVRTDFPGYGPVAMPTSTRDGATVTAPIYDQLGWTALPDGAALELRARVLAAGRTHRGVVRVVLQSTPCPAGSCACPDAPPECFGPLDGGVPVPDGDAGGPIDAGAASDDAG